MQRRSESKEGKTLGEKLWFSVEDLELWYKLETAGRIQRNVFGSEPELLGELWLHTCRRLHMASTEQPDLSREREFAKYSFNFFFMIIGYKQRWKRIGQSKSGAE